MSPKKAVVLNIIIALIFAGAILLSSWILKDTKHAMTVTYIIIALWFIPSGILTAAGVRKNKDKQN
jgi:ABC-type bacteriocin/lantibiotic exporter with double-glycine peptidase domain